jgi:SAM-dependent methyltransferase
MEVKRHPFQGVWNILRFNRHFYLGACALLFVLVGSRFFIGWSGGLFYVVLTALLYGIFAPLLVSAYVYDLSGFYRLEWLREMKLADAEGKMAVNIHAGFDETSFIMAEMMPKTAWQVFDFYDPKRHTEQAIVRARKVSAVYPNTRAISSTEIPLEDASVDYLFFVFSLHEIRQHDEKVQCLKECRRILKPGGKIILVEHVRDFPNFLAFSIGFMHFFSHKTWKKAFLEAGFTSIYEKKFTPFVSIFTAP